MVRTASRWSLLSTVGTAFRTALRPGSPSLSERLYAVPRLASATLRGEYPGATRGHLALLMGAALYVLSPVDLMPEGLLSVFGLADDAMVAAWLAASLVGDTERFLSWERGRSPAETRADRAGQPSAADRSAAPQDAPEPVWRQTVPSHVVR